MASLNESGEWKIREQVVTDRLSGLTFQFEVLPSGYPVFRVFGDLPFGNREFVFDKNGERNGAGTALVGPTKPTWICATEP
jgi:hypothetical protein